MSITNISYYYYYHYDYCCYYIEYDYYYYDYYHIPSPDLTPHTSHLAGPMLNCPKIFIFGKKSVNLISVLTVWYIFEVYFPGTFSRYKENRSNQISWRVEILGVNAHTSQGKS